MPICSATKYCKKKEAGCCDRAMDTPCNDFEVVEAPAPQQGSPSKSSDLLRCPVCERYKCREYQEPIDYTVCSSCLSVIVLGKDGTVSLLSHARAL